MKSKAEVDLKDLIYQKRLEYKLSKDKKYDPNAKKSTNKDGKKEGNCCQSFCNIFYDCCILPCSGCTRKIGKHGVLVSDDVNIYVPREIAVFPKCRESMDMAVKGNIDFAFDNTSPKTVSDSLKVFNSLYPDKVTVHTYEDKNYSVGSQLDHIKLIAR